MRTKMKNKLPPAGFKKSLKTIAKDKKEPELT